MAHGDGRRDVLHVVLAQQPGAEGHLLPADLYGEFRAVLRHPDVGGLVVPLPFQAVAHHVGLARVGGDVLIVVIQKHQPIRGHRVIQLKFRPDDGVHRAEALQVLLPNGGDHTVSGVHQIAYFLDVPRVAGAHLAQKDLVGGRKHLAHRAHHPQGGVVVARRHQHIVFGGKQRMQKVLGAGFAETARDAHHRQRRHGLQLPAGVLHIVVGHGLFHRGVDPVGQQQHKGLQIQRRAEHGHAIAQAQQAGQQGQHIQHRRGAQQPLHPGGVHQGFFGLVQPVQHPVAQEHGGVKQRHVGRSFAEYQGQQRQQCRHAAQAEHALPVFLHIVAVLPKLIGAQLQHVYEVEGRHPGGQQRGQGPQQKVDDLHVVTSQFGFSARAGAGSVKYRCPGTFSPAGR